MFERLTNSVGHGWVEQRLSDYLDNRLAPSDRARMQRHLANCPQCQESYRSLEWTVTLLKHAPAPVLPRSFVLPMPKPATRMATFGLVGLRLATALATLILISLIGVDLLFQFGGGASAPARQRAASNAVAPTRQAVALVPPPSPTRQTADMAAPSAAELPPDPQPKAAPPTVAAAATAAKPSAKASPTKPPVMLSAQASPEPQHSAGTNPPEALGKGGGPETNGTKASAEETTVARAQASPPPPAPAAAATATAAPPLPTSVPIPAATRTVTAVTRAEPTPMTPRTPPLDLPGQVTPFLRLGELGMLFAAIFFGSLLLLIRNR